MFVSQSPPFMASTGNSVPPQGLQALGGAFAAVMPTRGDLDYAVRQLGPHPVLRGQSAAQLLPVLLGKDATAALRMLEELGTQIDLTLTQAHAESRKGRKTKAAEYLQRGKALKLLALYTAGRFHLGVLARQQKASLPESQRLLARLSEPVRICTVDSAAEGSPELLPEEAAALALQSCELNATDSTETGAALTGYASAASPEHFYGPGSDDGELPGPDATTLEAANRAYPGAAQALQKGVAAQQTALVTQAFSFLRKERMKQADTAYNSLPDSISYRTAIQKLASADALILHWAPKAPAASAPAISAILRTRRLMPAQFSPEAEERAAQAVWQQARSTGSTAETNPALVPAQQDRLRTSLIRYKELVTRLNPDRKQLNELISLVGKVAEAYVIRARLLARFRHSAQPAGRSRAVAGLNRIDQVIDEMQARRAAIRTPSRF